VPILSAHATETTTSVGILDDSALGCFFFPPPQSRLQQTSQQAPKWPSSVLSNRTNNALEKRGFQNEKPAQWLEL
jgi:hypothetical protein